MGCPFMRWRSILTSLTCLALISYFSFHLITGDHGLRSRADLQNRVTALQGELAGLKAVRGRIERDVDLMRANRLDPDMLDEQVRAILNFAHPNDIVILEGNTSSTAALPKPQQ